MWTEELVIDGWGQGKDSGQLVDFTFEIGREYDIRLEFCNDARGVRVVFGYNRGRESFAQAVEAVKVRMLLSSVLATALKACRKIWTGRICSFRADSWIS